jgi:hypothetical protein
MKSSVERGRVRSRALLGLVAAGAVVLSTLTAGVGGAEAAPVGAPSPAPASAVKDATSAPDERAAMQVAKKFGHSVVVDALTTVTNQTEAMPDGTMKLEASAVPVRTKVNGTWTALDLNLTADGGFVVPKASAQQIEFSAGGSGPLARVQDGTGKWVEEASPFGSLPTPTVNGAVATYSEVLPGVDLRLTATATGMSEVLVVKSASAAKNPDLANVRFGINGSAVSTDASGNVRAGAKGDKGVVAGAPTWWDSTGGSDATGPTGTIMPQPVAQTVGSDSVTLDAKAAATAPAVTYPVYIDPDWSSGQSSFWYVDQAYPTQSYLNGAFATGVQREGYVSAANSPQDNRNHLARAFWNFNTSALVGETVLAAQMSVSLNGAFNCGVMRQSNLWTTSGAPIGGTWNQTGNVYSQLIGSATPSGCGAAVGFNALTAAQQAAGGVTSTTLALRANSETDQYNWSKWNQGATLTVTYDSVPNPPSNLGYSAPSASCSTSATSPTSLDGTANIVLQATASDPDANQNLATTFSIRDAVSGFSQQSYSTPYQAQTTTPQVTIPANSLQAGVYAWSATTTDGTDTSGNSSSCYFEIFNAGPGAPGVSPAPTGTAIVGQPVDFTFTAVAADGVKEFAYWSVYSGSNGHAPLPPANPRLKPGDALPACGTDSNGVTYVCLPIGQTSVDVKVSPVDEISTVWVVSYNAAARVSAGANGAYAATGREIDASSDTANFDTNVGHMWNTEGLDTNPDANGNYNLWLNDANTSNPDGYDGAFGDSVNIWWAADKTQQDSILGPPQTAELYNQHFDKLNSLIGASGYVTAEEDQLPANATVIGELGGVLPLANAQPEDTTKVYACELSPTSEMTSLDPSCEGRGVTGVPLGYLWNESIPTDYAQDLQGDYLVELDRCKSASTGATFDSVNGCASDPFGLYTDPTLDRVLGYVVGQTYFDSYPSAVDASKSFTATEWLKPQTIVPGTKYVGMAQDGPYEGQFELMIGTDGHVQFCVHQDETAVGTGCAEGPVLSTTQWTMVTGIYDASNHEVRLLLNGAIVPISTVSVAPTQNDYGLPGGSFTIGSATSSQGLSFGMWSGELADPSIFPGVISSDQLSNLHNMSAP